MSKTQRRAKIPLRRKAPKQLRSSEKRETKVFSESTPYETKRPIMEKRPPPSAGIVESGGQDPQLRAAQQSEPVI